MDSCLCFWKLFSGNNKIDVLKLLIESLKVRERLSTHHSLTLKHCATSCE